MKAWGIVALLSVGCLPNPQSVKERREGFDRSGLNESFILSELPQDVAPVGTIFEGAIELVGTRIDPPEPRPGQAIRVEYFWRVLRPFARDMKVFIHGDALEGDARRIHGDHWPAEGRYPTGVWQAGEIIRDPFTLRVPSDYGPPKLGLYSGLYRGKDRLDITEKGRVNASADDRALAVEIRF
ncbi:MAG: hypothetical protein AAGD10_05015 [Myxococcota bacterium]